MSIPKNQNNLPLYNFFCGYVTNPSIGPQAKALAFSCMIEQLWKSHSFQKATKLWQESIKLGIWEMEGISSHDACIIQIFKNQIIHMLGLINK